METPTRPPQEQSPSGGGGGGSGSPVPPSSLSRMWRPAAQRNLRNQWLKISSLRSNWVSASSTGKSHAVSLVNAFLSQKYLPSMEFGVLSSMPGIREKDCSKLLKQQDVHRSKLLSSYKDLVTIVTQMVDASRCMRCYLKGTTNSSLIKFGSGSDDSRDAGDGGGIPVFVFLSISRHEQLASELIRTFICELSMKRLLVAELLAIGSEVTEANEQHWSNELYEGEFNDLSICSLFSKQSGKVETPRLVCSKSGLPAMRFESQPVDKTLEVYLTIWLAEPNIDTHRAGDIISLVGDEMHVKLSRDHPGREM